MVNKREVCILLEYIHVFDKVRKITSVKIIRKKNLYSEKSQGWYEMCYRPHSVNGSC